MQAMLPTLLLAFVVSAAANVSCKTSSGVGPCLQTGFGLLACPSGSGCIINTLDVDLSYCCPMQEVINDNCAPTNAPTPTSPTCADELNPNTGVSDCPRLAYLCNDPGYFQFMTQECPKTCNRCPGTPGGVATKPPCFDKGDPTTGVSDCQQYANRCKDQLYIPFLMDECPKTCGFC